MSHAKSGTKRTVLPSLKTQLIDWDMNIFLETWPLRATGPGQCRMLAEGETCR